jgi:hypothetical protein
MAGMPVGMLVSLAVVALYTRRFGSRISRTESVARLLDEGMPLGEPSNSTDELGSLERGTSDPLTRLLNRRGFIPSAEHQLEVAK